MNEPITIAPLADHQQWLPMLARWLEREWPGWYGPDGPGDAPNDLEPGTRSNGRG